MNKFDLNNRVSVVTGGAQGFGLAIAKKFLDCGAEVIVWDIDKAALNKTQESIKSEKFTTQIVDITNFNQVTKNIELITNKKNIDIFINNAGITGLNAGVWNYPVDEWQKVININLTSTFLMCKFAIKKMLKNKSGKIVNITSVVGHTGNLGQANYTASKAGIVAMSKSLAIEYAKKNININCISPGFIKTVMTDKIDDKFKEVIISKIPSARLGEPDDIANAVLFLSSDQSNYINGETLHVNGGMYLG
jgi:3-oxoacyl-[acyl-carrier protein] reductase